jgi:DNA-binding NarL/FixJ family response regulator
MDMIETSVAKSSPEIKRVVAKCHKAIYRKDDWNIIYFFCNKLAGGIFDRIKKYYSDLDEKLFKICCLSCTGMKDKDIASLLRIGENTVRKYRNTLRKKLNIPERVKIYSFIIRKYG